MLSTSSTVLGTGPYDAFRHVGPYSTASPNRHTLTGKPSHGRCLIPPPGDLRTHLPDPAPTHIGQDRPFHDLCYRRSPLCWITGRRRDIQLSQLVRVGRGDFPYCEMLKGWSARIDPAHWSAEHYCQRCPCAAASRVQPELADERTVVDTMPIPALSIGSGQSLGIRKGGSYAAELRERSGPAVLDHAPSSRRFPCDCFGREVRRTRTTASRQPAEYLPSATYKRLTVG